jgi:hypothetical protein
MSANSEQPSSAAAPPPSTSPTLGAVEWPPQDRYEKDGTASPFVPILLGTAALLAWFGLQTWLLMDERASLKTAHSSQQQTVDNAAKLRQSLDALAADTQRLADAGNPNARLLVEELRKRGITINPNATPAAPAEATEKK